MGEVDVSRGNPNQCSILKSSTLIKYHFGHQKVLFFVFWGHFTKMCFAKFPPFIVKASSKNACHKIYWQQFVNRNIDGLQSWYSNRHFQIPITRANSTLELRLGTDCNFGLASTTTCERGFSKNIGWRLIVSRLKLETLDALMQVSLCGLPMENMDWAKKLDTCKSTKIRRTLHLQLDGD